MYKRKLNRLAGFDYSVNRYYFFTICVENHSCLLGRIENKIMGLSRNGTIAQEQWYWLGEQFPYIELVSFIVMPDHVHGIIRINDTGVGNGRDRYLLKIKPLPQLIGAYKTTTSKRIHLSGDSNFKWQKSYHDHIIRNNRSLNRIINYIQTNPEQWKL
jgi:putative transposase